LGLELVAKLTLEEAKADQRAGNMHQRFVGEGRVFVSGSEFPQLMEP
jgi:hypothetical protein